MANTYKSIVITPNRSSNTADPNISFRGGNTSSNTTITMTVYPDSNGSLSFDGSAGQLFSITNDLSNSIFSVNDVSGIPSIEVFANGVVTLAPISGNVGLGNTTPAHKLRVEGTASVSGTLILGSALTANGGNGSSGQVLTSNGSGVYWATGSGGTTTSANTTANGLMDTTTQTFAGNKTFQNTVAFSANANFDSGVLFVDGVNNRVGVNNTSPTTALEVTGTVTATTFSGSGASLTALNATALSTGTVPIARLDGNVILTTSTTGINASALSTGTVPIARLDSSVILTTSTTGINASALSTGTVPVARLDSSVLLTTSTTGINASALSTGTIPDARISGAYTNVTSLTIGGAVVNSTVIKDGTDDVRAIPVVGKTATYQLASSDVGRTLSTNSSITVNGAVLVTNNVFTVYNNSAASITITQGSGATMHLAGTASTGNRTLAQRGLCTIFCVAANTFVISGAGIS